jgi:predicted ATPase with chaperone activity
MQGREPMNMTSATVEIQPEEREAAATGAPSLPMTLEQTGLSESFVSELLMKALYVQGSRTGDQLAAFIRLSFTILDDLLLTLQQRRLIEVRGTKGKGRRGYTFALTTEGRDRCREIMTTSRYVGAAPVPLGQYCAIVEHQKVEDAEVDEQQVADGLDHLVLHDDFRESLGPAINSGRSLFLYGHAGNGKTVLAEAIAEMLGDAIYIPFAVEVDGQVIQIYDPVFHEPVDEVGGSGDLDSTWLDPAPEYDTRWVRIRRPVVMVGGELMLDDLELQFDQLSGVFRGPPQMKANGGVFIIDDFGRQRVRPRDLLNRWMVPLEKHVDFLSLPMGHKLPVPFQCLLIFATNLDPAELVEEAFLRRIRYKILVDNPTREQYTEIFKEACEHRGLPYTPDAVDFVFEEYYSRPHLQERACHPRDITNHLIDIARYKRRDAELSPELLRMACDAYFLDVVDAGAEIGAENNGGRYNTGSSLEEGRSGAGPDARSQDRLEMGRFDS